MWCVTVMSVRGVLVIMIGVVFGAYLLVKDVGVSSYLLQSNVFFDAFRDLRIQITDGLLSQRFL